MSAASHPATSSIFVTRRRVIQAGIALLGAAWAGVFIQSRLFPEAGSQVAQPVQIPLADLPVGGVQRIVYGSTPVLVRRTAEGLRANSLICTHLGCTVDWEEGTQQFHCPCHDGRFDQFGEVLSGPPAVALEQVPVQVQGDKVIVGETA